VAEIAPETVRIVLTGYTDVEPMLDAINRGSVYRFLLKPCDPLEFRSVISEGLGLKAATATLDRLALALNERRAELDETLAALRRSQEQLLAADRLATLGRTASGIVHDLRNSASLVYALLDLVRRQVDQRAVIQAAEGAGASLQGLLELLEQLREFARCTSVEFRPEPTEVAGFMRDTTRLFQLEQPFPVEVEVDPSLGRLAVDQSRLRQATIALLRNAARASGPEQPVAVHVGPRGQGICVEVRDQGRGMDDIALRRAGEPFFSGFSPPGLGLGLEIVQLAARAHGGRFELESSPGQGTTARLVLPLDGAER
jgi:signal transduction histidine kinase